MKGFLEDYCFVKKKKHSKDEKEFSVLVENMINMLRDKEKALKDEEDDIVRGLAKQAFMNTQFILNNYRNLRFVCLCYERYYEKEVKLLVNVLDDIEENVKRLESFGNNGVVMSKILYHAYIESGKIMKTREIQSELHIGNSHYHRLKNKAMALLAVAIGGMLIENMDRLDIIATFFEEMLDNYLDPHIHTRKI
ncbi:MAG: hypothetical protein IKB70_06750 [Bacilli bacterium]|nr:hypothetical protein [Bacilli bacterium]